MVWDPRPSERERFVPEGRLEVGLTERYFVFLGGEYLGRQLVDHFRLPGASGYTDLGRVRVTVERLEVPQDQGPSARGGLRRLAEERPRPTSKTPATTVLFKRPIGWAPERLRGEAPPRGRA